MPDAPSGRHRMSRVQGTRRGAAVSEQDPAGKADQAERSGPAAAQREPGEGGPGQWLLPKSPPEAPPPSGHDQDGAFAAPGGPVSAETEDWSLPIGTGHRPPATGFQPVHAPAP